MTKPELNEYRLALQNKRAEVIYRGRGRASLEVEPTPDEMDHTQGTQERDLAVEVLNRDAKLLTDVRAALGRIDADTFGICVDCEEEISRKRLTAVPWAASCIVCQEAADSAVGQPWNAGEGSFVRAA